MNLATRNSASCVGLKKGRGEVECPMLPFRNERTGLAFRTRYNADKTVSIEIYGTPSLDSEVDLREKDGPRAEWITTGRDVAIISSPPTDPWLDLDLRALNSYTYEEADRSTQLHYGFAEAQVLVTVTAIVSANNVNMSVPKTISLDVPFTGRVSQFIGVTPGLVGIEKIKVEVKFSGHSDIKEMSLPRVGTPPLWNVLTWHEDFVVDLPRNLPWFSLLSRKGSFILTEADSLEAQADSGGYLATPPPGSESFMSGYREIESPPDELVLPVNAQALTKTPGRYFDVSAQASGNPTLDIWAYQDDRFSLLFWRRIGDTKYRLVPFSTAGTIELKSAVTTGNVVEAVGLPGSIVP